MDNNHTDYTAHFVNEVKSLKRKGKIGSFRQLADSLNWSRTSLSNVLKGRRKLPLFVYKRFIEKYNLKPVSTIKEVKEIDYRDDVIALLKEKNEWLEKEVITFLTEIKKLINDSKRSHS